ncbi:hypothetical protein [Allomesorhizobium camelthorni]|uniref:Uncharacterized protein n=1 Tax=Allomesorhizobium camelthorni TaxID=475069 RepID=A0A6G4WBY0_9HYPH|nr:hypothetical protein [Mesorhizobium camelthorni]NGO51627.1 hypothetical protein [Mesorhizobium camelthorni]
MGLSGAALGALVAFALVYPNFAFAYCSEPSAPSCASDYGSFDDEWEFDRCKDDMEDYQSEVESFISCNNREAQEAVDQAQRANQAAAEEYSSAVDDFNNRTR